MRIIWRSRGFAPPPGAPEGRYFAGSKTPQQPQNGKIPDIIQIFYGRGHNFLCRKK